jgi:hypothetical protein
MIMTGAVGTSRRHFRRSPVDTSSKTVAFPRRRTGDDDRLQHRAVRQRVQCGERALVRLFILPFFRKD